ncbi:MAG TPA: hypothetical protein VGC08_05765, partial [Pedobacter sp.]
KNQIKIKHRSATDNMYLLSVFDPYLICVCLKQYPTRPDVSNGETNSFSIKAGLNFLNSHSGAVL